MRDKVAAVLAIGGGLGATVRTVVVLARDRNLTAWAAAIAYYAFVSTLPLLLLAVAVASYVGGEGLADRVASVLSRQLSESGQVVVTEALTETTGRGAASVLGFLTLSWSGLKLFRGLDQAFDEVYRDEVQTSLLEQIRNGVVVFFGVGIAFGLVVAVGVASATLSVGLPLGDLLAPVTLVVVLVLALLPIYYVLPPEGVSLIEVLPGTLVAAVGWVLLQGAFRIYASNAGRYGAYGVIGAVLLFVTWLYFAGLVVLLGAAINAVRNGARVDSN